MTASQQAGRLAADWLGLTGRVAVVTGAGSGIGRGIALELARVGALVVALDRDEAGAKETTALAQEETGRPAIAAAADVADEDQVQAVAARVLGETGRVDVLVNNAGVLRSADLATVSRADWETVLRVNLTGALICSQAFGAPMLDQRSGSIVHVASIAASHPQASSGAYSAGKAAVSMMSRQLAYEWGPQGVRSNVVSPGLIRTPMTEDFYRTPGVLQARSEAIPLRRVGAPEDLADAVTWLASPRSAYVTGQELVVDGGFSQTLMSHVPRPGY